MKASKRKAVEEALLQAGEEGCRRKMFEDDRPRFGTSFIRRIEELEKEYQIKKFNAQDDAAGRHDFIDRWVLVRRIASQPALIGNGKREVYIGTTLGCDFYEVIG